MDDLGEIEPEEPIHLDKIVLDMDDDDYMAVVIDIKLELKDYARENQLPLLKNFDSEAWSTFIQSI